MPAASPLARRHPPGLKLLLEWQDDDLDDVCAKTRTHGHEVQFFACRPLSRIQGRLVPLWTTAWDSQPRTVTAHCVLGRARQAARSSASDAPLTHSVPSLASLKAVNGSCQSETALVARIARQQGCLFLFKLLRHTKARKAALVAVTPRDAGRDKTTARTIL